VLFSFLIASREIRLKTGEAERDPNSNICVLQIDRQTHTHTHNLDVIRWEQKCKMGGGTV
jgi:hypothetical protein